MKESLLNFNYQNLKSFLGETIGIEEKKLNMRAKQIFTATYQKGLNNFENFSTIPLELRKKLSKYFFRNSSKIVKMHKSTDGTIKFLVELQDKNEVECVYIPEKPEELFVFLLRLDVV